MTAPTRNLNQRLEALETANRIRTARARLKVLVKTDRELDIVRRIVSDPGRAEVEVGRELVAAGLLQAAPPEGWLASMAVHALLLACPTIGAVKATRLMREAWGHLAPVNTRRVRGMNVHHRTTLAAALERHASRRLDYRSAA